MLDEQRMQEQMLALGGTYILNHAKRTLAIARRLAESEQLPYDEEVLVFSCFFHDISAFLPNRPEGPFDHAEESAKIMPALAKEYGIDESKTGAITEAVRYHDKRGKGTANETMLLRNADAIDYLGFMAVARDFSKQPIEMSRAVAALKKHRREFAALLELQSAVRMAEKRIQNLDLFLSEFEIESLGIY